MEPRIAEIAERLREMREILKISVSDMAEAAGVTEQEYLELESGSTDFTFTFLYRCAKRLGIDLIELITGEPPRLSFFSVVRGGAGLPIKRREGFTYQHLAYLFKNKSAEPFLVTAPYSAESENSELQLSYHKGQEFDYVLKGRLKVSMEGQIIYLNAGDAIYYDSGHGHGMVAAGGEECVFLAIVMQEEGEIHDAD